MWFSRLLSRFPRKHRARTRQDSVIFRISLTRKRIEKTFEGQLGFLACFHDGGGGCWVGGGGEVVAAIERILNRAHNQLLQFSFQFGSCIFDMISLTLKKKIENTEDNI